MKRKKAVILMVDDDSDDVFLVRDAFEQAGAHSTFLSVSDGVELLDYLEQSGKYADEYLSPRPDLILLDLNMPRKHGKEVLKEIKALEHLKGIPIVVLSTSSDERDISDCYCAGASAYVVKPMKYRELIDAAGLIYNFWFKLAQLPVFSSRC